MWNSSDRDVYSNVLKCTEFYSYMKKFIKFILREKVWRGWDWAHIDVAIWGKSTTGRAGMSESLQQGVFHYLCLSERFGGGGSLKTQGKFKGAPHNVLYSTPDEKMNRQRCQCLQSGNECNEKVKFYFIWQKSTIDDVI